MASLVLALPLLRFSGVVTAAGIAGLDSSTLQIQRSFPGIKTVLRTKADIPSCLDPAGSFVLTLHVVKNLRASTACLDTEGVSWPPWGKEEEVSSVFQVVVLDDQAKGWGQDGVGV